MFPEVFYYQQSKSQQALTDIPSDTLVPEELLQNNPKCWLSPVVDSVRLKKKLILADWSAPAWSQQAVISLIEVFSQLMDEGFELFVYSTKKEVDKITKEALPDLYQSYYRLHIACPEHTETICSVAIAQHPFTRDELFVIDTYWVGKLLDAESTEQGQCIRLSAFNEVPTDNLNKIIAVSKNSPYPVQRIVNDIFDEDTDNIYQQLVKSFPRAQIVSEYNMAELSTGTLLRIVQHGSFTQNGRTITKDQLTHLDQLILYNDGTEANIPEPELTYLKTRVFPNLKIVDFNILSSLFTLDGLGAEGMPLLQDLTLQGHFVDLEHLTVIAPNLRVITLNNCDLYRANLNSLNVVNLEQLIVNEEEIPIDFLRKIFVEASELTSLQLLSIQQDQSDYTILSGNLSNLTTFSLDSGPILFSNLLQIVTAAAANLGNLLLKNVEVENIPDNYELPYLNKLRMLVLNNGFFPLSFVNRFINNAPTLNRLALANKPLKAALLELKSDSLLSLDGLTLTSSQINGAINIYSDGCNKIYNQNIASILINAKKLAFLSIMETSITNLSIPCGCLEYLEELNLEYLHSDSRSISNLLKATTRLRRLKIIDIEEVSDNHFFSSCKLLSLEQFTYQNSKYPITREYLGFVLSKMPNLKFLYLAGNTVIEPNCIEIASNYPNLQIINQQGGTQIVPNVLPAPEVRPDAVDQYIHPTNPSDFDFEYQPPQKGNLSQYRIIQQLSQYCMVTRTHLSLTAKLNDGICVPLVHLFMELNCQEWDAFIQVTLDWDGNISTLTEDVKQQFEMLVDYIEKKSLLICTEQYLGDALEDYLATHPEPSILANYCHVISVRPVLSEDAWVVYDPNHTHGAIKVEKNQLIATIHQFIGKNVGVTTEEAVDCKLPSPAEFVQCAGLVTLLYYSNHNKILQQIPDSYNFPPEALQGLLVRNTAGRPAWARCLDTDNLAVLKLVLKLLHQFIRLNPDAFLRLSNSIEYLTEQQKSFLIPRLMRNRFSQFIPSQHRECIDLLCEVIYSTAEKINFTKKLQTWRKPTFSANSLSAYVKECIQSEQVKKRLIECESAEHLVGLHLALERQCQTAGQACFYVDSAAQLICSAPYVVRGQDQSTVHKGPGGPIYDFLQNTTQELPSVLIINYDRLTHEELIRFHTVLDKQRLVDGTPIPADVIVLGLRVKNKPGAYNQADFISRFDLVEHAQLSANELKAAIPQLPLIQSTTDTVAEIDLFHSASWRSLLLGSWTLSESGLQFQPGALSNALNTRSVIALKNGLWDDPHFVEFWQQAFARGFIKNAHCFIKLPDNFQLIKSEGYDWQAYQPYVTQVTNLINPQVLNPGTLNQFFKRFHCTNDTGKLVEVAGFVEAAYKKETAFKKRQLDVLQSGITLDVYLSHKLELDQWARLLAVCGKYAVGLRVQCAPGVCLPAQIGGKENVEAVVLHEWSNRQATSDMIVCSDDPDTSVFMLTTKGIWHVIDVSECSVSDLFTRFDGRFNSEAMCFEFTQTESAILKGLRANQQILLKGTCSEEVFYHLAALFMERQWDESAVGTLVLITFRQDGLGFMPFYRHQVRAEDKLACLGDVSANHIDEIKAYLDGEPLSRLQSRYNFLQHHPETVSSDVNWDGMYRLDQTDKQLPSFNIATATVDALAFTADRLQEINTVLSYAPYAFLAGPTGVGKSTFVTKELSKHCQLYQGRQAIQEWAQDRRPTRKVLFLDEVTLEHGDLSEFEGLYQNPKNILLRDTLHLLDEYHKLVVAGNPVNYGDERKLPAFLKRHGNAVVFKALPPAVLYEEVLKPIFIRTILEPISEAVATFYLEAYRFVFNCSQGKARISPRELQMMAILSITFFNQHPLYKIDIVVKHYISFFMGKFIPNEYAAAFNQMYPSDLLRAVQTTLNCNDFYLMSSHAGTRFILENLLYLHFFRQVNLGTEAFQYGGLGGLVLSGEPGMGKSEMLTKILNFYGFVEVGTEGIPAISRYYYRIPATMPLSKQKTLLCRACDEGAIVVKEEINSSPIIEQLLNDLLMGIIPNKGRPSRPGFLLLSTQNPSSMSGRRAFSPAFARRVIEMDFPSYTEYEMRYILLSKGLPEWETSQMIIAYRNNRLKAQQEGLMPAPCFRDVIRLADQRIAGIQQRTKMREVHFGLNPTIAGQRNNFFNNSTARSTQQAQQAPNVHSSL